MADLKRCPTCEKFFKSGGLLNHMRMAHGMEDEAARRAWEGAETRSGTDWLDWSRRYLQAESDLRELQKRLGKAHGGPAAERYKRAIDALTEYRDDLLREPL